MKTNDITGEVIATAIHIHKGLGPGLLESVYETVQANRIRAKGLNVVQQYPVSFDFDGVRFENGFKIDLLVEDEIVVELKSIEKLAPVHHKQVLTYLRLQQLRYGLLINFGESLLKNGIHRIVNGFEDPVK